MPLQYSRRLIAHLQHKNYVPRSVEALAQELGVEDAADFARAVRTLAAEGVLRVDDRGRVMLPSASSREGSAEGTFKRHPRGFGFVALDDPVAEGDLFVPPESTGDALTGDRVRVAIHRQRARDPERQFIAEIVEVLDRKRSAFTGDLYRRGGQWLVEPDGRELTQPVVIRDAESKNAREGLKVAFELVEYPEGNALGEGVITRVLGEAGRPDVETQAVITAFDLPGEFPEACLEQARELAREFEAELDRSGGSVAGRADLTRDFVITIDPPDAKDYDDAISLRRVDGLWELGVHIADVGHFVDAGTPLDVEARERGNSVYLPRLVIPMLPEVLSNGICSLQEGVPRYVKSAIIRYDDEGRVRAEGATSGVIRSAKRLTYLEAQALIDGDEAEARRHARTEPRYTKQLLETLRSMDSLAKRIQGRRQRQGMISLELPEVVLIFDEEGRVVDAEREDDAFTHTLIEMFMVEANEVLARLFERLAVPVMRRIHPDPTPGDVDELRRAARVAGYTIPARPTREELQGLLNATRGTPAARAVHMAVLRTLTKAEYSPAPIGHFALASSAYSHFTSPIRRYADLLTHRLLGQYLRLTRNGKELPRSDEARHRLGRRLMETPAAVSEDELVDIGRHISATEQNAEDAERQLRQFLVLQLLADHVGDTFSGVVTGVTPRGVFVQIDKYLADGMVKREDLPGDVTRSNAPPSWRIDDRTGALVDQRSGRSFNMGDTVRVRVASVDLSRRQLDLVIDDGASRAVGKAKRVKGDAAPAGGLGSAGGFTPLDFDKLTGGQRRSRKSKARDRGKQDHRRKGRGSR